jgi:predicted Fe-S protein YdhL (DUF1289 family)
MSVANKVRSPCVSICALNEEGVCIGCHRSGDEIMSWMQLNNEERREVLRLVAEREKKALI